jgi:hypothetical protein
MIPTGHVGVDLNSSGGDVDATSGGSNGASSTINASRNVSHLWAAATTASSFYVYLDNSSMISSNATTSYVSSSGSYSGGLSMHKDKEHSPASLIRIQLHTAPEDILARGKVVDEKVLEISQSGSTTGIGIDNNSDNINSFLVPTASSHATNTTHTAAGPALGSASSALSDTHPFTRHICGMSSLQVAAKGQRAVTELGALDAFAEVRRHYVVMILHVHMCMCTDTLFSYG